MILNCLIVALGGACGAVGRYLIGLLPLAPDNGFPVKTFIINVSGAFLIGIIAALAGSHQVNPRLVTFIKVGICGGFTTFSSFALETDQLIASGKNAVAFFYVIASIICGVCAVFAAQKIIG